MKSSAKNKKLIIKADSFNAVQASAPGLNVNNPVKRAQHRNFEFFSVLNPDWCYAAYMFLFDLLLNF
jgi:hypothetical protein